VDTLLTQKLNLRVVIKEAHPELIFCMLNGGNPLLTKKNRPEGLAERLLLLNDCFEWTNDIYEEALTTFARKDLARDDIVDALACLAVAMAPENNRKTVPSSSMRDELGIEMVMHYASTS
jgi:predicted RNase H-like nuclease